MAKTVIGLVDTPAEADAVVAELLKDGFDRERVGVIANEQILDVAAGVAGAARGMAYGSLAGLVAGVGALAIPGLGPVIAVGPALALLTTTIGALAGGLIGGLVSRGVPKEDAQVYAEGLRRGGTLIMVEAKNDDEADRVLQMLMRHRAVDVKERAAQWRSDGWNGRFEPSREPAASPPSPATTGSVAAPTARDVDVEPTTTGATSPPQSMQNRPAPDRGGVASEVAAVHVYQFAYSGPERRQRSAPYAGPERRVTA